MQQIAMVALLVKTEKKCKTHNLWNDLNDLVDNYLTKITLSSLVNSVDSPYIKLKEIK